MIAPENSLERPIDYYSLKQGPRKKRKLWIANHNSPNGMTWTAMIPINESLQELSFWSLNGPVLTIPSTTRPLQNR